jgi:hypothetical protein
MSYEWISRDLIQWVAALPDNDVTFVVDYVGDWTLLYKLFKQNADECVQMTITKDGSLLLSERDQSIVKKKLRCQFLNHAFLHMLHERGIHMPQDISKGYAGLMNETPKYFKQDSRQHHALVDAKANRYGWIKGYEAAK